MCQLTVKLVRGDRDEVIARDVASIEIEGDAVTLAPLFEDPITLPLAAVVHIDSMSGTVLLREVTR